MTEQIIDFDDRDQKRRFLTLAGALQGPQEVTIKPWKPRRSNRANSFYFAVVVAALRQFLAEQGDNYSVDECHDLLKTRCLGTVKVFNRKTGEFIAEKSLGSAMLDTSEFSAYVERCIAWLADFGIEVPSPEMVGMKAK